MLENPLIMNRRILLPILILLLIGTSCVPARKFEELETKYNKAIADAELYKTKSQDCDAEKLELNSELDELSKNHAIVKEDLANLDRSYKETLRQYEEIKENHKILKEQYDALLKLQERESQLLGRELDAARLDLQKKEDELTRLAAELSQKELRLVKLEDDLQSREQRVNELEAIIAKKDAAAEALRKKISDALLGFKDKGLTVEERDGKVYVSMEAKLLFASGKTAVGSEGKKAIIQLAKALEGQVDLDVLVEGHTDVDEMHGNSHPADNWELSVLRATSVVKIMTSNSTIDPKILTAAGRSKFMPVGTDKAKNRRIEVILIPKLNELFDIINK
ncbi:MAG: chemotaxis protein MotB [Parvicellaceae bacterium]|jgi:chemotaxis protein MotB